MTTDQKLDRAERMLILFVKDGRRARRVAREQDERISIIIKTQMETEEIMKRVALRQERAEIEIAELRAAQKLTDQALRALLTAHVKARTGNPPTNISHKKAHKAHKESKIIKALLLCLFVAKH